MTTRQKTKKRAIILQGSPRTKNGNTAIVLNICKQALKAKNFQIKQFNLYSLKFRGCAHCDCCRTTFDRPACILSDDLSPILDQINVSDLIVVASPIYCWSFTGCASAALDRWYTFFKPNHPNLLQGKQIIGLFTAEGTVRDGMDLCIEGLRRLCDHAKANYVGTVGITRCSTPKALKTNVSMKRIKSAVDKTIKKLS